MIQNEGTKATEVAEAVDRDLTHEIIGCAIEVHAGIRLDLKIARRVVVEVKSVERLHQIQRAQLLTYLKLTGLRTGLLFNFNVEFLRNGMRRIVNG